MRCCRTRRLAATEGHDPYLSCSLFVICVTARPRTTVIGHHQRITPDGQSWKQTDIAMPDVFISYSKKDKELARELAEFLAEAGLECWWDEALVGGVPFRERIHEIIDQSRAGIVIWSKHAAKSDFVNDEADLCRQQGKLISVVSEGFPLGKVPLGFRNHHLLNLADGAKILEALKERQVLGNRVVGAYVLRSFSDRITRASVNAKKGPGWILMTGALLAIALVWPIFKHLNLAGRLDADPRDNVDMKLEVGPLTRTRMMDDEGNVIYGTDTIKAKISDVSPIAGVKIIIQSIEFTFLNAQLEVLDRETVRREFILSNQGYEHTIKTIDYPVLKVEEKGPWKGHFISGCWTVSLGEGGKPIRSGRLYQIKEVAYQENIRTGRVYLTKFEVEPPQIEMNQVAATKLNCRYQ